MLALTMFLLTHEAILPKLLMLTPDLKTSFGGNQMPVRKAKKKAAKKPAKKVRCAGKTKEGKRCKRMASPPSKFCHAHKKKR